jgi:hypothetical protein
MARALNGAGDYGTDTKKPGLRRAFGVDCDARERAIVS